MKYVAFYAVGFSSKIIDAQEYNVINTEELEIFLHDLSHKLDRLICLKILDDDQNGEEWVRTKAIEEIKAAAKEIREAAAV